MTGRKDKTHNPRHKQYMARGNLKWQAGARPHKDIWGNPVKCNAKVYNTTQHNTYFSHNKCNITNAIIQTP